MYELRRVVTIHAEYRREKLLAEARHERLIRNARGGQLERRMSSTARLRGWLMAIRHPRAGSGKVSAAWAARIWQ